MRTSIAALTLCLALTAPLSAQVVRGKVVDSGSGAPVVAARVQLLRSGERVDSTVTDTAGAFLLRGEKGGKFRLAAERVGYTASVSPELQFAESDSADVVFRISASAVLLEPLEVVSTTQRRSPALRAFYDRAENRRFGHFFTRDQIERRHTFRTSDVLRGVPGLQFVPVRGSGTAVRGRGGCVPVLVVDGMRVNASGGLVDVWVNAHDVEGLEVYNGAGQAPAQYSLYENGCAIILVWTREW